MSLAGETMHREGLGNAQARDGRRAQRFTGVPGDGEFNPAPADTPPARPASA